MGFTFGSLDPETQAAVCADHDRLWAVLENVAAYASWYRQSGIDPSLFTSPIGAFLDYRPLSHSPPAADGEMPAYPRPAYPLRTQSAEFQHSQQTASLEHEMIADMYNAHDVVNQCYARATVALMQPAANPAGGSRAASPDPPSGGGVINLNFSLNWAAASPCQTGRLRHDLGCPVLAPMC